MTYSFNSQIDLSRDGLVSHENPQSAGPLIERARSIFGRVRQHGNHEQIDASWRDFQRRGAATSSVDAAMAVARECLDYLLAIEATQRAEADALQRADIERSAAKAGAASTVQSRRAWATAHLRPLFDFGAALSAIAGKIEDARGVEQVSVYTGPATAPVATDAELAAFLDELEPLIRETVDAAFAKLRADIAARAA